MWVRQLIATSLPGRSAWATGSSCCARPADQRVARLGRSRSVAAPDAAAPASAGPSASGRRSRCRRRCPRARSCSASGGTSSRGASALEDEEDVDRGRLGASTPSSSIASRSRSMPAPKPTPASAGRRSPRRDSRSGRRPRSSSSALSVRPDELPGRARVVVEPADERRHRARTRRRTRRGRRAPRRSARAHASQSDSPIFGASVEQLRTSGSFFTSKTRSGLVARFCARRVELVLVLGEPGAQLLEIRGPAVAVADRVELEPVRRDAEAARAACRRAG